MTVTLERRKPGGVLMCMPTQNQTNFAHTTESIFSTGQWLTAQGIPNQLCWFSGSDIVEVRNMFLTMWFDTKPEYEWMFFIDADMGWHPKLVHDYLKFNKPLMGTLYAKRQMDPSVVGSVLNEEHTAKDIVEPGFMRAVDLGGGLMMINRSVVAAILAKFPEISDVHSWLIEGAGKPFGLKRIIRGFDPIMDEKNGRVRRLSEDVSFCTRYRETGGEVWANVDNKIDHVGPFNYHLCYGNVLRRKALEASLSQTATTADAPTG
jgi:hypothetical protein